MAPGRQRDTAAWEPGLAAGAPPSPLLLPRLALPLPWVQPLRRAVCALHLPLGLGPHALSQATQAPTHATGCPAEREGQRSAAWHGR